MKKIVIVLCAFVLLAGMSVAVDAVLAGSGESGGGMRNSSNVVQASAVPGAATVKAGERVAFKVNVQIQDKWHLYAHEDSMFIGIDLSAAEGMPLEDLQVVYPDGQEGVFFGETVLMLEGDIAVEASALVPAGMATGDYELAFALTVQACDDKMCLAPADLPLKLTVTVP